MRWRILLSCCVLFLVVAVVPASAQQAVEKRVAFVVGIGAYNDFPSLRLAVPDATAVAAELEKRDFTVVMHADLTKENLLSALDSFVEAHRGADVVLIYFAGHAVQIAGKNYLLTRDARWSNVAALQESSVELAAVFERAGEVAPRRIILLDACRDDPSNRARALADASRPIVPGLGRFGRADGTVYVFAASPGRVALDGDGEHSPFTSALLTHIGTRGLQLTSMMKLVQMEVYDRTRGAQLPYIEDAMPGLFFVETAHETPLSERNALLMTMGGIDADARTQVVRIAAVRDIPLAPLFSAYLEIEARLGRLDYERREASLQRAADDIMRLREQTRSLASADPEVIKLRTEAERHLSLGTIASARRALDRAIELDADSDAQLEARLRERRFSQAASRAIRAGLARARLEYRIAAADLAAAAKLVESWDKRLAWEYAFDQVANLLDQGRQFGEREALVEALAVNRRLLTLAPRSERPADWISTQQRLAIVLGALGQHDGGTEWSVQATAAYGAALEEAARDRRPQQWAKLQSGLAVALADVGMRTGDPERLRQAIATYRRALEVQTRENDPQAWAATQANLAIALTELGDRGGGTDRFAEAMTAYRAALQVFTREHHPVDWARTQQNLALVLVSLDRRPEAIDLYREALTERTRARTPLGWAATMYNLAAALRELAGRESSRAGFLEAIEAYREVLTVYARDRVPLDWATAMAGLASALRGLGELERSTARLEESVAAYRESLQERTRERVPSAWASTQFNLANVLSSLGDLDGHAARFEEAIAAYRGALLERTRERAPLEWAETQYSLGETHLALAFRHERIMSLRDAIAAYRAALEIHTRDRFPMEWGYGQASLGVALMTLAVRTTRVEPLEEAAGALRGAVEVFTASKNEALAKRAAANLARVETMLGILRSSAPR
jgi:uncharacterized caspase-like protein